MGFHDGKFYDAKLSREYYEGLKKSRTDFDVNADLVRSANNAFDANTLYNGDTARAHKRFIKNGCGKMLNDETDMMAEMTSHQEYMMSAFEGMVDADPNARIEINTLDTINRDFKGFHGRFKELTEQTHKVVTDLNNEFGAEVGGFPFPNGPAALEPLTLLCGGEDPGKGYFKDCQNMLISYDETVHGYLKSKDIPYNTQDLNKRVKATKQIINAYSYADPKVDEVKIDQLEGPKVKAVKVVNKRMEDFCKEVDKYFDKKIDQSTVIGDGKNFGDGSFLCSFEMIEASKSPQAKAVLASPYYGPAKKMITENAKPHIANSNAYMINPRDTAIAFGVGGAAQSYVENGNISGIGENAENFYQAFQQGGASYVIDSVAGTCSMPGAVTSFVPLGHGSQGAFTNLVAYPNSGNNTVLPLPSTVQGLINTNTSSAGINGQITNLWNNFGNTIGSHGQANIGTTMNNMFQTLGYITVFGSSFFINKLAGSEEEDDKKGIKYATSMTGTVTISALSKKQELLLMDPNTGEYEFEELMRKIYAGYKPTEEEIRVLAELFDEYFDKLASGTATEYEIEVAEHLLNGLVVITEDSSMPDGICKVELNESLINELLKKLKSNSLAAMTINGLRDEIGNVGLLYPSDSILFDIKEGRIGIDVTLKVVDGFGDVIGKFKFSVRDDQTISVDDSKRVRTGNVSDSFVTVIGSDGKTYSGGNQGWFENDPDMGKIISARGCGVIATVNQYLYLTGQTTISQEAYKKLVYAYLNAEDKIEPQRERYSELRRQQIEGPVGGAFPGEMTDFVTGMCEQEGVHITSSWDYTKGYEADYESMKKQLENGIPVVWGMYDFGGEKVKYYTYDSSSGRYENKNDVGASSHYVTATAIYEETDENGKTRRMVEISSWGQTYYVDYDQYVEAVSEPGVNRPFSSITNTTIN